MAHIVVYLQRTQQGLHPASAVGLCWARDIASDRGATLTAALRGDAGSFDDVLVRSAVRCGADIVVHGGDDIVVKLHDRLDPVHTLVPWTDEGCRIADELACGPVIPRWIERPAPPFGGADAVTGVVAGHLPWYQSTATLEPEFEGGVDSVEVPAWTQTVLPYEVSLTRGPIYWIDGAEHSPPHDALESLNANVVTPTECAAQTVGTAVWCGPAPLPEPLCHPGLAVQVLVLSDASGRIGACPSEIHPSWKYAHWVLHGPWLEALRFVVDASSPEDSSPS